MKTLIQVMILSFLAACGKAPSIYKVDKAFVPYVATFQALRTEVTSQSKSIKQFELKFKDQAYLGPYVVGSCRSETRMYKEGFNALVAKNYEVAVVEIDPEYWSFSSFAMREQLINHGLGHCILNQGHSNGLFIMNPNLLSENTYKSSYAFLINKLFIPTTGAGQMVALIFDQAPYVPQVWLAAMRNLKKLSLKRVLLKKITLKLWQLTTKIQIVSFIIKTN